MLSPCGREFLGANLEHPHTYCVGTGSSAMASPYAALHKLSSLADPGANCFGPLSSWPCALCGPCNKANTASSGPAAAPEPGSVAATESNQVCVAGLIQRLQRVNGVLAAVAARHQQLSLLAGEAPLDLCRSKRVFDSSISSRRCVTQVCRREVAGWNKKVLSRSPWVSGQVPATGQHTC